MEQRLSQELSTARGEGTALTLVIVEPAAPSENRPTGAPSSSWSEVASRHLLVGDDWTCDLTGDRKAFCLTHTGPESNPAIQTILERTGSDHPIVYGIAYYPADAKSARRLIEVAARRLEANRPSPVTATSR